MRSVVLVGCPNVGKSSLFHRLTSQFVVVSNYPGTTVEITTGICQYQNEQLRIVDTPGLYSLYPITEEERVTRSFLTTNSARWLVHIVDAKSLQRMLPLTLELIDARFPLVVVVNMLDEAKKRSIHIDLERLAAELTVPVVGTACPQGTGIQHLRSVLFSRPPVIWPRSTLPSEFDHGLAQSFHERAAVIYRRVVEEREPIPTVSLWDRLLLHPLTGLPIALLILYLVLYRVVARFGAGMLVDFLDQQIYARFLGPVVLALVDHIPSLSLQLLLAGEYGVFTMGFRYAFVIILPIVAVFFLIFSLLEDSGYLPRLSFLFDGICKQVGLSGRGMIPLVLGLGCGTMATVVTRTLETRREQRIATFLLAVSIPCSAQLGVMLALLATEPLALLVWLIALSIAMLWLGSLLNTLLPGTTSAFYMELPPLRLPSIRNGLRKTWARLRWYFWEILPIFVFASVLIWVGELIGLFPWVITKLAQVVAILNLPSETATVFFFGFLRRDYGAAGLYDLQSDLSWQQLSIICVMLTLFVPCVAQCTVMVKERGMLWAALVVITAISVSFSAGLILQYLLG